MRWTLIQTRRARKAMTSNQTKRTSRKQISGALWQSAEWLVKPGKLVPRPGRPSKASHLFRYVAEKLPFDSLESVEKFMVSEGEHLHGVYFAHDSMGVARYGSRGAIFNRLSSHRRNRPKELLYYSFYVIENKNHEREVETAILRAAGPQMTLNKRKVASGLHPGNIGDYEPGTKFFERQGIRGRKRRNRKRRGSKAKLI
jgi:hypothetical protein